MAHGPAPDSSARTVAAGVAAALAVLTVLAGPAVRPAPGTRTGGPH